MKISAIFLCWKYNTVVLKLRKVRSLEEGEKQLHLWLRGKEERRGPRLAWRLEPNSVTMVVGREHSVGWTCSFPAPGCRHGIPGI